MFKAVSHETAPPSSSIVIEVGKDGTVKGFFNDEEMPLGDCVDKQPCKLSDFEQYLRTSVSKIPNVTDYCKERGVSPEILN